MASRLRHCAFVAMTIVALGTTITSLSHRASSQSGMDVPELEYHRPPLQEDPIRIDANGTVCLNRANLDALGKYKDAYLAKTPLCSERRRLRPMETGSPEWNQQQLIPEEFKKLVPGIDTTATPRFVSGSCNTLTELKIGQACVCGSSQALLTLDEERPECFVPDEIFGTGIPVTLSCNGTLELYSEGPRAPGQFRRGRGFRCKGIYSGAY